MRNSGSRYIAAAAALLLALTFSAALLNDGSKTGGDKPTAPPPPATEAQEPTPSPSETWSNDGSQLTTCLLDIDLDPETQWAIYQECGSDNHLFCRAMAIAYRETGGTFQADAVGDNGGSIGMFQINTRWHTDRMERLGVTDLTNPVQCAAVAVDYLQELVDRYGFEPESEALLMAYNMGPGGAKKALDAGTTSTEYSREVWAAYQGYLEEMEADKSTAPGAGNTGGGK